MATVPALVVKRSGGCTPGAVASEILPSSLRLSPKTTTWLKSVATAAVLNSRPARMAPARRVRGMTVTLLEGPGWLSLFAGYGNALHTEAHAAPHRGVPEPPRTVRERARDTDIRGPARVPHGLALVLARPQQRIGEGVVCGRRGRLRGRGTPLRTGIAVVIAGRPRAPGLPRLVVQPHRQADALAR